MFIRNWLPVRLDFAMPRRRASGWDRQRSHEGVRQFRVWEASRNRADSEGCVKALLPLIYFHLAGPLGHTAAAYRDGAAEIVLLNRRPSAAGGAVGRKAFPGL